MVAYKHYPETQNQIIIIVIQEYAFSQRLFMNAIMGIYILLFDPPSRVQEKYGNV